MVEVVHGPALALRGGSVKTRRSDLRGKRGRPRSLALRRTKIRIMTDLPEHLKDHALFIAYAATRCPRDSDRNHRRKRRQRQPQRGAYRAPSY